MFWEETALVIVLQDQALKPEDTDGEHKMHTEWKQLLLSTVAERQLEPADDGTRRERTVRHMCQIYSFKKWIGHHRLLQLINKMR